MAAHSSATHAAPIAVDSSASGSTQIPLLDLRAQYVSIKREMLAAVERVLESQHFILGSEVQEFEEEIAKLVGTRFAIGCASGSDALLLALTAIGIQPGDEVITTPFTFVATAGSVARLRAKPVFVDIDPETYDLDTDQLQAAITRKTRAIIPVHLFGLPADMRSIASIAEAHDLEVIEDAAQAIAARYEDKGVGSIGAFGCFSFFPSKNLGGAGDGGIVTTNDPLLADHLRILRVHGSRQKYNYEKLGMNSRLDSLQAAILRVKLRHLEDWTWKRRRNAERYRRLFAEMGISKQVKMPAEREGRLHVYNQFVIRAPHRDRLRQHLRESGIATEIYYPSPLHLQPAFAYLGYKPGDLPQAESACEEVLALPIFPELTEEQQVAVVDAIARFYGNSDY